MLVRHDVGRGVALADGKALGRKRSDRLAVGHRCGPALDVGADHGGEVIAPAFPRGKAFVGEPLTVTGDLGELFELVLAHTLHDEVPFAGRKGLDDADGALGLAGDAHRVEVRDEVGHRNGRIEHGDVDVLPFTGGVTVAKGGEHPDHAEQSGTDIAERPNRIDDRWPLRQPLVFIDARHALDHRCIGSPVDVRRRGVVPEAGDREVDRCGVDRLDGVVPDAEAVGGARLEVLAHDVGGLHQFEAQTHAFGVLEVQGHRALVEVVAQEGGTHRASVRVVDRRHRTAARITGAG